MGGGFCMKTIRPGMAAISGRNCSMIWSTEWVRSSRGFMRAEHERLVASDHEHADILHVRVGAHDFARRVVVTGHPIERSVLRAQRAGEHEAAILAGDEAGGHGREQVDGAHQHEDRDAQGDQPEAHGDAERHLIPALHRVEAAFQRAVRHAMALTR